MWTERWRAPEARLHGIEQTLRVRQMVVRRGGDYDRWDLEARGGVLGVARMIMGVEEHGQGRQMVRARLWPRAAAAGLLATFALAVIALLAYVDGADTASRILALAAVALGARIAWECGTAVGALRDAAQRELWLDR